MATGLVAYDNTNGEKASKGGVSTNRIAGTVYATSLDLSSTITVGTATLSSSRLDPGSSGTFDIGTTSVMPTGIGGNSITITAQKGGPAESPIGAGRGGDSLLKGGTGGASDGIMTPGSGGDANLEGGVAGLGIGSTTGKINIGINDTSAIIIGSTPMMWNVDGGGNIGWDGSTNKRPGIIRALTSVSAGDSITMKGDRLSVSGGTGDPGTLVAGDLWYRTDLGKFKFRNATTDVELLDASTAIANPSGKNTNDLLQYTGSAWDAKGGTTGDRLGKIWAGDVDLTGSLTFTADGSYDIGASATTLRPRYGYFSTGLYANNKLVMKADDSATGTDLSGTYPTGVTVAKVQGYSMTSGAPAKGDVWQFDGTNWIHDRSSYRVLAYGATSFNSASGEVTICSYATGASEFTANSMVHMIFVVKNGSNPQIACRSYYGGTKLTDVGGWTYSHNKVDIWDWVAPDNTSNCQYYYDHYGGVGTTDLAVGANWMTTGATWSARIQNTNAGGGTTYVRAWIIELHQGA